jgi:hypothetical protein
LNVRWLRGSAGVAAVLGTIWLVPPATRATAPTLNDQRTVVVRTTQEFRAALATARPGSVISLAPGRYAGGSYRHGIRGTASAPIVIQGLDPAHPPVIAGGANGLQLSDAEHVTLRDLVFDGAQQNGVNIDDGETFDTPSHHVTLTRIVVRNIPSGNRDGIKLSGVTDFLVQDVTIERWGDQGSAIDMVGCHRGVISGSMFRHTRGMQVGNGVQAKGGSANITIRNNRFEYAAARAVQIGGPTGAQFFRPQPPGRTEARDIVVERNVFVGGETAVAFVSSDGGVVRFNTIYRPDKYLLRILRENTSAGIVATRNGVFTDNIVYWTGDLGVNIGAGTEPASFSFARNSWYRADAPGRSAPALPRAETDGKYGVDPQFAAPPADLRPASVIRQGAHAR